MVLLKSFSCVTILLVFFCALLQMLVAIMSCFVGFGDHCCHNGGNVVPEFVAFGGFGGLIGTFVFAFSRSANAVLLVDFEFTN